MENTGLHIAFYISSIGLLGRALPAVHLDNVVRARKFPDPVTEAEVNLTGCFCVVELEFEIINIYHDVFAR